MKKSNPLILTKKLSLILSGCAAAFFYSQSIRAEELPQRGAIPFYMYDINANNSIRQDEFNSGMRQYMQQKQAMSSGQRRGRNMPGFTDFDGNKDGYISEQELIEARSMRISNRIQQGYQMRNTANISSFQEIDKNNDDKISPEEFSARQKQQRH